MTRHRGRMGALYQEPEERMILTGSKDAQPPCASAKKAHDWMAIDLCATAVASRKPVLRSSGDVATLLVQAASMDARAVEHVVVVYLDSKLRPIAVSTIHKGGVSVSMVDPASVLRPGLLVGAYGIIMAHNHPSSDPQPSADDDLMTGRVKEAAKIVGMRLLDHMVIGMKSFDSPRLNYFSYADNLRL